MKTTWQAKKVGLGGAIISSVLLLCIGILIGANSKDLINQFGPYLGLKKTASNNLDWSPLDEVYNELSLNYNGDLKTDEIIEGAKKGLVSALNDQYTIYMTKKEARDFEKSLHGEVGAGVGIEMSVKGGYVRVNRTLPDNPARKAGILAGDILYKVDGEEIWDKTADVAASKIRGKAGTEVTLTVVRDKKELEFKLIREEINNVSADVSYEGKTAIIKITRFDKDTGTKVREFAKDFKNKKIEKVIVDLRGNGGGYVQAAKDLLSLWIDGEKVFVQRSKNSSDTTYATHGQAILKDMKTIILVNNTTASASEMTAGALQDYKKATIIGEKTFGKGVVQTLLSLSNESLLKVTTAHWYTPKGKNINNSGITPDKTIEMSYDDVNANRDPQMEAARNE